jgi:hypothetical protein
MVVHQPCRKAYVEHKFKTYIEIDDLFHPLSKMPRKSKKVSTPALPD